jgi:hypothetical protein
LFRQADANTYIQTFALNNRRNDMFTGWILTIIHSPLFLSIKRYLTHCALQMSNDGPNHYKYVLFQQSAAGRPGYPGRKTVQLSAYMDYTCESTCQWGRYKIWYAVTQESQ